MKTFEVSGNLVGEMGLGDKCEKFKLTICNVRNFYISHFGEQFMNSIDLYVDNATRNSGHTPIIAPVLGKYLMIKLGITPEYDEARIAFQFAHELMHFVFYIKYGLDKKLADEKEEAICSAAALIVVHNFYPKHFNSCNNYVKSLQRVDHKKGAEIAEEIEYQFADLIKMI